MDFIDIAERTGASFTLTGLLVYIHLTDYS
jgi:hypothetical protein